MEISDGSLQREKILTSTPSDIDEGRLKVGGHAVDTTIEVLDTSISLRREEFERIERLAYMKEGEIEDLR